MENKPLIPFASGVLSPRIVIESDNVPVECHATEENEPHILTFKTERKRGSPSFRFLFLGPNASSVDDTHQIYVKRKGEFDIEEFGVPWQDTFQPHGSGDNTFALEVSDLLSPRKLSSDQQKECRKAIRDLLTPAGERNWDGEDADPVRANAVEAAVRIVAKLPGDVTPPEISADVEGNIEFDWNLDNGAMFTLSIRQTGDIAISGLSPGRSKFTGMVEDVEGNDFSLLRCGWQWLRKMRESR